MARAARGGYLQKPIMLHIPLVGGDGQSPLLEHALVHTFCIMIIYNES